MRTARLVASLLAASTALATLGLGEARADGILSGSVSSAGKPLGGVTISAKAEGSTVATSVFTDAQGRYFFPPLPPGTYRVRAQAVSFAEGQSTVRLDDVNARQDFALKKAADFERQLTGDEVLASLPEATPEDREMKQIFRNNCVGCHTPGFTLQHRFDAAGWTAVMELMKRVNVYGSYQGPDGKLNQVIDHNEKALAAYLARARGPGATSMVYKLRPRPSGEAARVVFKEYDVPVDPALKLPNKYLFNDGSDWSEGVPSAIEGGKYAHDAWPDLDGNLWFTNNTPSPDISIGRIDARTGEVKFIKIDSNKGFAANAHGMTRDPQGFIWFNIGTLRDRAGLAKLDPKTEKITVYVPPEGMSGAGGATTVDFDGKGKIWLSTNVGALRFDPVTEQFTEFKSVTPKTEHGMGATYGVAGDSDGNGWWAQMAIDILGHGDGKTGQSSEIHLPPVKAAMNLFPPAERKFYEGVTGLDFSTPLPWSQGPRRMGADKNGHVLWVCDYYGGNLLRVDTRSLKTSFVPLPDPENLHPYHAVVDSHHDVWVNFMNADQVMRYEPKTGKWTAFDLPGHGAETRYVSILERNGQTELVLPYYRTMKVAVMTLRSERDIEALRHEATGSKRAEAAPAAQSAALNAR